MKICAIISEFNPFHLGHKFIIDEIKKQNFTHIVAIMSGDFVQRGEPAIISKEARVKSALLNGVDLVIEMPACKVLTTAEKYAWAGIETAEKLGCVDSLAFGSECGNINILKTIVNALNSEEFKLSLKKHLSTGITFAKAEEYALNEIISNPKITSLIKSPNNILGVEYLKALKKIGSKIKPLTIKRTNNFKSACEIRELIKNQNNEFKSYIPLSTVDILNNEIKNKKAPLMLSNAEQAILYSLQSSNENDILNFSDVSEGLENKILNAAYKSNSLPNLINNIKSKRYTMARIKRAVLTHFLKINVSMQNASIPYIKILGTNLKGTEILKKAKKTASVPIISRFSQIKKLNYEIVNFFENENRFSALCGFFAPKPNFSPKNQIFKIIKGEKIDL